MFKILSLFLISTRNCYIFDNIVFVDKFSAKVILFHFCPLKLLLKNLDLISQKCVSIKSQFKLLIYFAQHILVSFKWWIWFYSRDWFNSLSSLVLVLINQIVINSFFHLASISLFYLMSEFLVFNIVVNVGFGWLFNEVIICILSMLHKIILLLNVFKFLMLLNWKRLCKLLAFNLIWIMLHNNEGLTAFCFFEKIWRISIFCGILKWRGFVWMGLLLISGIIHRCDCSLDNILNLFIRVLLWWVHYIRNSLRVISFFITPCIFNSYVNWVWSLQNFIILNRRISPCVSCTWNSKWLIFVN